MAASDVVEDIIKLGMVISEAAQKDGKVTNWEQFVTGPDFAKIADTVTQLLNSVTPDNVTAAVQALSDKQQALLGGKTLAELPTDKLLQYGELGNAKVVLAANEVADSMDGNFANWLVNTALPALTKAAPVIVPLLV